MNREETQIEYKKLLDEAGKRKEVPQTLAKLGREDLFFLLCWILNRRDIDRDWLFDRCREVQAAPNGYLDIWAREHYKSSLITYAMTIQDIINDPEITIGIFSLTRPMAKSFLRQIKQEFEGNKLLKECYPDILWEKPEYEAPKWSEDDGIIVKRKSNPKEATLEAWGLVDAMPTGRHFKIRVYDDIIDERNVGSPDMIEKATKAWALSLNLGSTAETKRYKEVNIQRYAGTRYHFNDPYRTIMQRGTAIPRIYPGTVDGTPEGEPVLWSRELMATKRRDMGPFIFSCHARGTAILMADWSWKRIENVRINDEVVGFVLPKDSGKKRTELVRTKVLALSSRIAIANEYTLKSGGVVRCTPDHKWWTGRHGSDGHKIYSALGDGEYRTLSGLVRITKVFEPLPQALMLDAAWLGGILDGEGTISSKGQIVITQSVDHNPAVCMRLEEVLARLEIKYAIYNRDANDSTNRHSGSSRMYILQGGRPMKHRLVSISDFAKRDTYINRGLYNKLGGLHTDADLDKVVDIKNMGEVLVHNIQTETGNYIAEGYASKNCQVCCNPVADEAQGFKREWIRYWNREDWSDMNLYLLCDPAGEKKKTNDYTVMLVIGLGVDRNYYLVDGLRDRMNLTERTKALFRLHRDYQPLATGYEKYGKDSDIEHINEKMDTENYRFEITPLGGATPKNDRIRKLIPDFENHRWFLPQHRYFMTVQGKQGDIVDDFLETEYDAFPVAVHDDIMDCMARIKDTDLGTTFPLTESQRERRMPPYRGKQQEYDVFAQLSA